MSGLSAFLKQNALPNEVIKYPASRRFQDEEGKQILWEIQSITSDEDEALRRTCTKRVQAPGKKNHFVPEVDYNKYLGMLAAACTKYPNLNDKELQDSYGVMSADALLKAMLKPGEYAEFLARVQEANGHDAPMEELVDEAKN